MLGITSFQDPPPAKFKKSFFNYETLGNKHGYRYTGQCCGSGMFILNPGSDFFPSRIPDPNCLHPGSSSKNLSILTPKKQKNGFQALKNMIRVVHPGSRIRILTFSHPGSRIQGSKRYPIPDPGSGSATLIPVRHERGLTSNMSKNTSNKFVEAGMKTVP
jgi:hypothetical protein